MNDRLSVIDSRVFMAFHNQVPGPDLLKGTSMAPPAAVVVTNASRAGTT